MRVHFVLEVNGSVVNTIDQADLSCPFEDQFAVEATAASDIGWLYTNGVFIPPHEPVLTEEDFTRTVQTIMDSTARKRNYDTMLAACSYASSTVGKFKAEGLACLAWRDAVWSYCHEQLEAMRDGRRAPPTFLQLVAELPLMVWPE